jgi:hypothetical protein
MKVDYLVSLLMAVLGKVNGTVLKCSGCTWCSREEGCWESNSLLGASALDLSTLAMIQGCPLPGSGYSIART